MRIRQFYIVYGNMTDSVCQIESDNRRLSNYDMAHTLFDSSEVADLHQGSQLRFSLSWSHYLILMRIKNPYERSFYEIECTRQMWSVRQLSRQVNSSLYERLALSRDKDAVMRLATEGQEVDCRY